MPCWQMFTIIPAFIFSRIPVIPTILLWILSTILFFRKWIQRKYSTLPPGPTGWPLIGNFLTLKGKAYTDLFPKWRREHGSIFSFSLGTKPVIVIGDFHGLHEAYINTGNDLSSKPVCPSMAVSSNGYRDVRLAPFTDTMVVQRKLVEEELRDFVDGGSVQVCVNKIMQEATNDILQSCGQDNGSAAPTEIHRAIHEAMFKVMHKICFGGKLSDNEITPKIEPVMENLESLNGNFGKFFEDAYPFLLKIWPSSRFSRHKVTSKVVEDYVYHNYRMTKRAMDFNHPTNLTQKIIVGFKDVDASFELTDMHLIKNVCNVFYGGISPTSSTILWAIYIMCTYPGMQDNVYEEVTHVVGEECPSQKHLAKLVYTQAFIQEVWRLFPPLPVGTPHTALRNTQLRGHDIPKDSLLLVDYYAIQRDPRLFSNPLDFRPGRFVSRDGNDVIKTTKGYAPFSMGARKCIGDNLARELVVFTLIAIVQKVKLSFPQGYEADFTKVKDTFYLTPESFPVVTTARVSS